MIVDLRITFKSFLKYEKVFRVRNVENLTDSDVNMFNVNSSCYGI